MKLTISSIAGLMAVGVISIGGTTSSGAGGTVFVGAHQQGVEATTTESATTTTMTSKSLKFFTHFSENQSRFQGDKASIEEFRPEPPMPHPPPRAEEEEDVAAVAEAGAGAAGAGAGADGALAGALAGAGADAAGEADGAGAAGAADGAPAAGAAGVAAGDGEKEPKCLHEPDHVKCASLREGVKAVSNYTKTVQTGVVKVVKEKVPVEADQEMTQEERKMQEAVPDPTVVSTPVPPVPVPTPAPSADLQFMENQDYPVAAQARHLTVATDSPTVDDCFGNKVDGRFCASSMPSVDEQEGLSREKEGEREGQG